MKRILVAVAVLAMMPLMASATPQAKEIAFTRSCTDGVPLYSKSSGSINCGKPQMGGHGYVIEMATNGDGSAACPKGYNFIGLVQGSGEGGSLKRYACAKE